jgi:hypothetical protein
MSDRMCIYRIECSYVGLLCQTWKVSWLDLYGFVLRNYIITNLQERTRLLV